VNNRGIGIRAVAALCAAAAALALWAAPRAACAQEQPAASATGQPEVKPPAPPVVTIEEAAALIAVVRSRAMKEPAPANVPASLSASSQLPLIVTLYSAGRPVQRTVIGPSLREAAEKAGDQMGIFLSRATNGIRSRWDVVEVDVVAARQALAETDRRRFIAQFDPGIQGLACTAGGRTDYFTPIALFRNWGTLGAARSADMVKAAYAAQESREAPLPEKVEQIQTLAFVEKWPGGPVFPLYRGNVLLSPPSAQDIERAMLSTGRWFLQTQQQDGSFLRNYFPADQGTEPTYGMTDHLRATVALALLYHHTRDERFAGACERAAEYCYAPDFVNEDRRGRFWLTVNATDRAGRAVQEPSELTDVQKGVFQRGNRPAKEETAPSALLLTALCYRALDDATPTADGRMNGLGMFLCEMVAPDGRLHASFSGAGEKSGPFSSGGATYAETLTALDLLQRVSPTKERREAAARIADLLATFPSDVRVLTDDIAMGRVAEALAAHYKLSRNEKHAQAVLKIANALLARQITAQKAQFADYVGGFEEGLIPPDMRAAAAGASGLAAAYDAASMLQRPAAQFAAPVRSAALFLMNMQYRPENTFYLAQRDLLLGAFRRSPEDLGLHLGATAESVRALMAAFAVVAENAAPEKATENAAPH
jgi:hypothetical protein